MTSIDTFITGEKEQDEEIPESLIINKDLDFIESYSRHIIDYEHGIFPLWAKTLALITLAPFVSNAHFEDEYGVINTNVFGMIIGPSGLARKTVPMKSIVTVTLNNATKVSRALYSSSPKKKKDDGKEKQGYEWLLPSSFSNEAMTSFLKTNNRGVITIDEFTRLLKDVKSMAYMSDRMEFLSQIYDGVIDYRATRVAGREKIDNVNISLAAATTPALYRIMQPEFFVQGTGNRFFFVIPELADHYEEQDADYYYRIVENQQNIMRDKLSLQYGETLAKFEKFLYENKIKIVPASSGEAIMHFIKDKKDKALSIYHENPDDLHYSYLDRMELGLQKLIFLFSMSHVWKLFVNDKKDEIKHIKDIDSDGNEFYIYIPREEDINSAISLASTYIDSFDKMLNDWNAAKSTVNAPFLKNDPLDKIVKDFFEKHADKDGWVSRWSLIKWLNPAYKSQWQFYEENFIEKKREKRSSGAGRPIEMIRLKREDS
jgi:hypothetical protein